MTSIQPALRGTALDDYNVRVIVRHNDEADKGVVDHGFSVVDSERGDHTYVDAQAVRANVIIDWIPPDDLADAKRRQTWDVLLQALGELAPQ